MCTIIQHNTVSHAGSTMKTNPVLFSRVNYYNSHLRQVLPPLGHVVLDPGHDGLEGLLLGAHVELVRRHDVDQLRRRQQEELFAFHHLGINVIVLTLGM